MLAGHVAAAIARQIANRFIRNHKPAHFPVKADVLRKPAFANV
jgi:hypothetical protein